MNSARTRLAAIAAAARYPPYLLVPRYTPGEHLAADKVRGITGAVEVHAEARLSTEQAAALLSGCRADDRERWRECFWTGLVKSCARDGAPRRR